MAARKQQAAVIWLSLVGLSFAVLFAGTRGLECRQTGDGFSRPSSAASFRSLGIDALNPSLCGVANFRRWQLQESAFGCKQTSEQGLPMDNVVEPRIVNGELAMKGEFPFFARVEMTKLEEDEKTTREAGPCGGTIIHENLVITAAHCVEDSLWIELFFGSNTRQMTARTDGVLRMARKWCWPSEYLHAKKQNRSSAFDMAVIRFDKPLVYEPYKISPACLWPEWRHSDQAICALAGFGQIGVIDWNINEVVNRSIPFNLQTLKLKRTRNDGGVHDPLLSNYGPLYINQTSLGGDSGSPLTCYDRCPEFNNTARAFVVGSHVGGNETKMFETKIPGEHYFVDFNTMEDDLAELIREVQKDENEEDSEKFICKIPTYLRR